jgi:hypothetical protein
MFITKALCFTQSNPSIIDAWFNASEMIASFSLNKDSNTPHWHQNKPHIKSNLQSQKLSDLLLKFFMNILRTANEPDAAHPISMRFNRGVCRFNHFG